jgi:hypothetical protein
LQRETKERWRELCEQIVREHDPERFDATILELFEVLERNERRRHDAGLRVSLIDKPQVEFSGGLGVQVFTCADTLVMRVKSVLSLQ